MASTRDEVRKGQCHVEDAHENNIGVPAVVACHDTDQVTDYERRQNTTDPHEEIDPRRVDGAREDVASKMVGAEPMARPRRLERRREI